VADTVAIEDNPQEEAIDCMCDDELAVAAARRPGMVREVIQVLADDKLVQHARDRHLDNQIAQAMDAEELAQIAVERGLEENIMWLSRRLPR